MPAWQKGVWILICLSASWFLEDAKPLFRLAYDKWSHARVNLVLLGTTLAINTVFTVASVGVFVWIAENRVGLLHLVELPIWAELLLAFLLLDLVAQYVVHFLLHRVGWMWRFHMVHHSDVNVDATTGTRHHPVDYVMREAFALVTIVALGALRLLYRLSDCDDFLHIRHARERRGAAVVRPDAQLCLRDA